MKKLIFDNDDGVTVAHQFHKVLHPTLLSGSTLYTYPQKSIPDKVRSFLETQAPLTPISLADLYHALDVPKLQMANVRAALHGTCAGTPVARKDKPARYYGIRFMFESGSTHILSGIPRDLLKHDHKSDEATARIMERLRQKCGEKVINFWARSAQYRSVDQANRGMQAAKKRDSSSCLLCGVEGVRDNRPVRACHLVSRKTLFWRALNRVDLTLQNLFTEEATILLEKILKEDANHSDSRYLVTLCVKHDHLLLTELREAATPRRAPSPLFEIAA